MARVSKPKFWQDFGFYFALLLLIFVVIIFIATLGFSYRSALFPLVVCIGIVPLIILDIMARISTKVASKVELLSGGDIFDLSTIEKVRSQGEADTEQVETKSPRLLIVLSWLIGGLAVFYFVGYLPFIFLFVFCFLRFFASRRILPSFLFALGLSLITWVIFTLFLRISPISFTL